MSKSTISIEMHRGHEIFYDADNDKFICEVASSKETTKTVKRQSLKDIRHEIDLYLKVNTDFKPFKALVISNSYRSNDFDVKDIIAVRSDGIFIAKSRWGNDQIKLRSLMASGKEFDQDALDKKNIIDNELKWATERHSQNMTDLIATLKPLDLSAYDYLLNDTNE